MKDENSTFITPSVWAVGLVVCGVGVVTGQKQRKGCEGWYILADG